MCWNRKTSMSWSMELISWSNSAYTQWTGKGDFFMVKSPYGIFNSDSNSTSDENAWALFKAPSHVLIASFLAQRHHMSCCDIITSRCNATWHHMTWPSESAQVNPSETSKITFSRWRPLTYDLQSHLRYCQGEALYQILGPYIKWFSRQSAD